MTPHELEICEFTIRHLERRYGAGRAQTSFPEDDRSGPPVECRVEIGDVRFAIEHTLIEPFERFVEGNHHFDAFAAPLRSTLDGTLPRPGFYKLHFPLEPLTGIHRRKHEEMRAAIEAWVRSAAEELADAAPRRRSRIHAPFGDKGEKRGAIHGIDLHLTREVSWAQSGAYDGRIGFVRVLQGAPGLEALRFERIARALARKCPKLALCKMQGDESILVLEWNDFSLTNEFLIANAVKDALGERDDWPDQILIVDTTIEDNWNLIELLNQGSFTIDEALG